MTIYKRMSKTKKICLWVAVGLLVACDGPFDRIGDTLKEDLNAVTYHNGVSITEGKIIADAYLYIHGNHLGPAPYVNITDGGDAWEGLVYHGLGVSPVNSQTPPVRVDKKTGQISWGKGPVVDRIDPSLIVNKKITASRSISGAMLSSE